MAENARLVELEKDIAHLQRQLEIGIYDPYHSATYWRERCLKAERELDFGRMKYAENIGRIEKGK